MDITLRCIALRTTKHSDRHSIVTAWSEQLGRVGLLISAGNGREDRRRRALMMPLGMFECHARQRPGSDLFHITEVVPIYVPATLTDSPTRSAVALFMAEVIERTLRDAPPDQALTRALMATIELLDTLPAGVDLANFPITFLCQFARHLGIAPDVDQYRRGNYFDLNDGRFRPSCPLNHQHLPPEYARIAAAVLRADFRTAGRLRLPLATRRAILATELQYFSLHLCDLTTLRSLPILQSLS
ncbi:MAG: DNA repair protein RecO [Muribaculaceae bacterium]